MEGIFKNKYRIQSTRLPNYDYGQSGFYFITICTKNRINYFGKIVNDEMILNDVGEIVRNEWLKTPTIRHNVILDEWIIMPNHFHAIIIIKNVETHCNASRSFDFDTFNDVETHCNASGCNCNASPCQTCENQMTETHCNASLRQQLTEQYKNKFGPQKNNLSSIIRGFKSTTTKQINQKHNQNYFAWQPRFYDHIIKNETSYHNIRKYILNNPSTWQRDKNNIFIHNPV